MAYSLQFMVTHIASIQSVVRNKWYLTSDVNANTIINSRCRCLINLCSSLQKEHPGVIDLGSSKVLSTHERICTNWWPGHWPHWELQPQTATSFCEKEIKVKALIPIKSAWNRRQYYLVETYRCSACRSTPIDGEEVRVSWIIGPKVSTSFPNSSRAVNRNLHTRCFRQMEHTQKMTNNFRELPINPFTDKVHEYLSCSALRRPLSSGINI